MRLKGLKMEGYRSNVQINNKVYKQIALKFGFVELANVNSTFVKSGEDEENRGNRLQLFSNEVNQNA